MSKKTVLVKISVLDIIINTEQEPVKKQMI